MANFRYTSYTLLRFSWYISYTLLRFFATLFVDFDHSQSYTLYTLLRFTTLYYAFQRPNPTLSVGYFRRLWPYAFATLGPFSLHSLCFTTHFSLHFATLWYISYTFWDQILRFWYTIFVDSDLSLSYILSDVDFSHSYTFTTLLLHFISRLWPNVYPCCCAYNKYSHSQ
jgi:hypothetical protein